MIDDGAGILSDIATPGARRNKNVKKRNFPQAMSQLFAANWLPPTRPMKERNLGRKQKSRKFEKQNFLIESTTLNDACDECSTQTATRST